MKIKVVREKKKYEPIQITLETQEEADSLDYILYCDVNPSDNPWRREKLQGLELGYGSVVTFQSELHKLLREAK